MSLYCKSRNFCAIITFEQEVFLHVIILLDYIDACKSVITCSFIGIASFIFLILTVVCICLYGTFESGNACKRTTKTKTFFPYLVIFVLDLPDV